MAKIISTKGIGNSHSDIDISKVCLPYAEIDFSMRTMNELKLRAAKKLKIPIRQIGFNWSLTKKSDVDKHPNATADTTMILSSSFKNTNKQT